MVQQRVRGSTKCVLETTSARSSPITTNLLMRCSQKCRAKSGRQRLTGSVTFDPTGLGFSLVPVFPGPWAMPRGAAALERKPCLERGSAYVRFRPWRDELPVDTRRLNQKKKRFALAVPKTMMERLPGSSTGRARHKPGNTFNIRIHRVDD